MESSGKIRAKGLVILLPFLLFSKPVLYNTVDRKKVFTGEQILFISWAACIQRPERIEWKRLPSFNGFWMEDVRIKKRVDFINIGKKGCWAYPIKSLAIFPQSSGKVKIGGGEVKIFLKGKAYVLKGNEIEVRVKPLPERADWVGTLQLNLKIEPDRGNMEIIAQGQGNIDLLPKPKVKSLKGELIFAGSSSQKNFENGKLKGKKIFIYAVRGNKARGEGFFYRVFNPEKKKMMLISTPSFSFFPSEERKEWEIFGFRRGVKEYKPFLSSFVFWGVFSLCLLLMGASLVYRLREKFHGSIDPLKEIEILEKGIKNLPKDEFYSRLEALFSKEGKFNQRIEHLRFSPHLDSISERIKILNEARKFLKGEE